MQDPLIIQSIIDVVEKLKSANKYEPPILIPNSILNGTQTIIRQGNNLYYPEDLQSGRVKIITLERVNYEDHISEPITWDKHNNWYSPDWFEATG